ncbi:MAG: hypothetical protein FWD59_05810, partial [Micrococcales bacterium]|nr:hypothetical protein [Micrococcales bacterium]
MTHVFHPNRATLLAATAVLSLFVGGGLLPAIAADPATEVATSPSPSSVLVTVEGTVLEIADLPDDANHLFIEAAPGLAVPLDPDSLPEPVASGQSVTATLEVPEWVVAEASEEIAALDDGDLPPQVEASDEVGEVLMEAAAELDAALDVAGLSVTTDSPVYLAADSAPHIVDLVFFSRDGRGKFYSASEIDYLLGSLSAWWARETKGEIPAFVYSYAEARAAQTTAHCTATFAQMSNEAAQLFGHASYSNPYMMPNSRRHLVILSPVDEYGTGCPRLYTGAGYYGYGELAAGGVVHLTTQSVETSVDVLVHEIGHNLSLPHASAGRCPSGVVDGPIGSADEICVYGGNDYSDSYNVMGLSQSWATTGLSGFQKERLGLLTRQSPEFQVVEALGSYDIALRDTSRASGPGVEALQVVDTLGASKRNYWIEYDSRSGGVHVRRGCRLEDETLPYPGGNVPSTWILSPEGSRPYSSQKFLAGQGFISDGGGMVFRVDQVSEDVARVHVELSATPTPSVSTSLSSWSPEGTYRTTRVVITTNQAWWSASSDESWLTLSTSVGNNGMEITLFAAENLTGLPRSATVSFVAGGAVTRLPVLQAGQPPKITLSITGWFPGAGVTTITTTPSTNQATWSASTDAEWLTVSPPTGARGETAWITAVPNAEKTTRVGRVTFEAGGVRATLPVTQDALRPSVQLFPTSWSTGAGANSTGLFVSTNMPSWVASTDQSWLTVTPANGVTGDMAQVSAEPNTSTLARTGTVRFSADTGSALFTVTQAGATQGLTLSHSLWFPNAAEERLEVGVSTNQSSWSASSNQTWLTTSPSSGSAGQTMTVIVTASELSASRSGVVTVVAGEARATLVVRQEPKYVSVKVSPPLWTPEAGSSSSQVWVTTNQSLSWSASSNQSWLTVSSSTGISGAAMTLAASANTTGSPRSATVSVVSGTARTTVAVTQAEGAVMPPSVSLSASMWSAGAGVASTGVVVSTNQSSWSASSNQSWLSVSPSSGQDGQTMTVSAQANTSPASRSAMVLVSAGGASTTLSVLQAAGEAA